MSQSSSASKRLRRSWLFAATVVLSLALQSPATPAPAQTAPTADANSATEKVATEMTERQRHWLDHDVKWLISDHEKQAFESLTDDEMREAFIKAFWLVRDPTPGTPANEFKTEHFQRITDANRLFGRSKTKPGALSPRGKLYIQLGPPQVRDQHPSQTRLYPLERWLYQPDRRLGLPPFFHVIFFQPFGAGDYELYEPGIHGPEDLVGGMTANASEFQDERQQALRQLKHVNAELYRASLSLIPTDPIDPENGRIEPGSQRLAGQLFDVQNSMPVDTSYVERILSGAPDIQIEYSFRDLGLSGSFFGGFLPGGATVLHYSLMIPPESLTVTRYNDEITGVLQILGRIFRDDGITPVLQIDERVEMAFHKKEFERLKRSPFAFQDMVPLLPGDYRATIIVRNVVTREFGTIEQRFTVPTPGEAGFSVSSPLLVAHSRPSEGDDGRPFAFDQQLWFPSPRADVGLNEELRAIVQVAYDPERHGFGQELLVFWHVGDDPESSPRGTRGSQRLNLNPAYDHGQLSQLIAMPAQTLPIGPHVLHVAVESADGGRVVRTTPFEVVSPRAPVMPWVYANRADLDVRSIPVAYAEQHLAVGDEAAAILEYERALSRNSTRDDVRLRLAELLLGRKEPARAAAAVKAAADKVDASSYAMVLYGMALSGQGDGAGAIRVYQRAVAESPRSVQILNLLGEELLRAGQAAQARVSLERSLALEPDQDEIQALLEKATATPPGAAQD